MATDLGEYGSGEGPVYVPPVRPRARPTRGQFAAIPIVLLLLVVEVVVLGGRLQARQGRDADPARVATAFFTAVRDDQAAAAAALTRLPAGTDTSFSTAKGEVTRPVVTGIVRHGDRATAVVRYAVGDVAQSAVVLARSYDGFLHAPTWRIVGGLPVVHLRTAPFETTSSVNGRRVTLHRGAADVTVLPGVVRVTVAAHPPAAATGDIVFAASDGTVVRFPATLDVGSEDQLSERIFHAAVAQDPSAKFFDTGSQNLDVRLNGDGWHVTFSGRLSSLENDPITGPAVRLGPTVSGTATYAGGQFTVTQLHLGSSTPPPR